MPSSLQISIKVFTEDVGGLAPSWAPVADEGPRTVEGILAESRISGTDFPFRPWHETYDWNFFLRADPQYTYLVGKANSTDDDGTLFELEWETKGVPSWAWAVRGSRLWAVGRWIYDCGHPGPSGHHTELHPLKAVASFRRDGLELPGNAGVTRTTRAAVLIGPEGGFLAAYQRPGLRLRPALPPKPHPAAVPRFHIRSMIHKDLPVEPQITPFPTGEPRALRVVIPLKGVVLDPRSTEIIIHGGWSDPGGAEAARMRHLRVSLEQIFMDANLDRGLIEDRDEWRVYLGVNGRWQPPEKSLGGESAELNFTVPLSLHPDDPIEIAVCGYEADEIDNFMGRPSGVPAQLVRTRNTVAEAREVAEGVRNAFLKHILAGNELVPGAENTKIGVLFATHRSDARGTFTETSEGEKYRLRYRIEDR